MSFINLRSKPKYLLWLVSSLLLIAMPSYGQIVAGKNLLVSGFGTFSAAKSDNAIPILPGRDITDSWCFDCDTTFGLQLDWQISSKLRSTLQVVKKPDDTFSSPEVERALIEYSHDNWRAKIGRLKTPLFMMSEYYYVSSAYPWLRLPQEVYDNSLGLTYLEGIALDFTSTFDNGSQLIISPYLARPREEQFEQYGSSFSLDISRALGFSSEFYYADNLVHFTYVNLDASLSNSVLPATVYDLDIYSLGISHYFGSLHLQAEAVFDQEISSDWYVSLDYQYGAITPYIRYGQARKTLDTESILFGCRYDWTPNINTSIEWQRFYGRENVISGQFTLPQDPTKPLSSKVDLFSIGLSFTF